MFHRNKSKNQEPVEHIQSTLQKGGIILLCLPVLFYIPVITAGIIKLKPGFIGTAGFIAEGIDIYPTIGNTTFIAREYNEITDICPSGLKGLALKDETESLVFIDNDKYLLYPNPNAGKFKIKLENPKQCVVEVYNINGSLVEQRDESKPILDFDLSNKPKGIYIVKIFIDNTYYTEKIVITK